MTRGLKRRAVMIALPGALAVPGSVAGHPGSHDETVLVDLIAARQLGDGAVELDFAIYNISPSAVTLRGMWARGVEDVWLSRPLRLFGWSIPRRINFLRLEPGELVMIQPPGYRAIASGLEPGTLEFDVELDFGPVGRFVMPVSLP